MSQAIHIFRKDVRHLSLEIALALILTALFVYLGVSGANAGTTPGGTRNLAGFVLGFLLPLNFAVLIARAVHDEALPGDRQFWLTRPYQHSSLLAAKALLVLAFVAAPLTIAQGIIIKAYGFAILDHLPGLLCTQALIIAGCVLPVMALASMTTGFLQTALGAILIAAAFTLYSAFSMMGGSADGPWFGFDWVQTHSLTLIAASASLAIVALMYTKRATATAVLIGAGALAAAFLTNAFLPWTAAFALQSALSAKPAHVESIQAGFASARSWAARVFIDREGNARLLIPMTLTGIPAGLSANPQGITATIEAPGEPPHPTTATPTRNIAVQGQLFSFQTDLSGPYYQRIKNSDIQIHGTVYLTLYDPPRRVEVPFNKHRVTVPEVGNCVASKNDSEIYFLTCDAAFRNPPALVSMWFDSPKQGLVTRSLIAPPSYSPLPGEMSMNPIHHHTSSTQPFQGPFTGVLIDTARPAGFVRRPFSISNLRLSAFEVRPSR